MKHFNRLSPFGILPFIFIIPFLASCGGGSQPSTDVSRAEGESFGDYSLNYYEDKKGFMIEDYRGNASSISIPSEATLDGIAAPIVGISDYAFANRSVQDVYLSESIRYIGAYAFHHSKLRNLYVTPYLTTIDPNALDNCDITFNEKDGVRYLPSKKGPYGYAISFRGNIKADITLPDECEAVYDHVFTWYNTIRVGPAMKGFGSIGPNSKYTFSAPPTELVLTKVGDYSLRGQSDLASVTIEDCATSIGDSAFSGCSSLSNIYFLVSSMERFLAITGKDNLKGDVHLIDALSGAEIKGLVIPDSITSIGDYAFYHCSSLTSVTIGSGLASISESAFEYCSSLKDVNFLVSSMERFLSITGKNNLKGDVHLIDALSGAEIKGLVIPDSITSIGDYAFYHCPSLISATIGSNVTSIGEHAFEGCYKLASVVIGKSVNSIGMTAFLNCYSLVEVVNKSQLGIYTQSKRNGYVGFYAYQIISDESDSKLSKDSDGFLIYRDATTVAIVGYYGENADVIIPNDVTSIGQCAFADCFSLKSVTIGSGVTSIGYRAFADCPSLESIVIPDSVTSIGNSAFANCSSLESIVIPDSVTSIENGAFYGCSSLTSVIIPASVTSIGEGAFCDCSSLTSVTIGSGVTSIGAWAFYGCSSLESVTIGGSVTSIGYSAFYGCSSLTSIVIPASVTSIGSGVTSINELTFCNCPSLSSIIVDPSNPVYDSRDGCNAIIETAKNELVAGCKSTIIPDSVTSIGYRAFFFCSSLESLVIPDSVTSIGEYAFWGCSSLSSIIIPKSVDTIGEFAFDGPATIYCEASSKPNGWDDHWCSSYCQVVWGYQGN